MVVRSDVTAHEAYQDFQRLVRMLKVELVGDDGTGGWSARLASNDVPWFEFTRMLSLLTSSINAMDITAATPGIVQYVQAQEQDPTYNIAAEYTAMHSAVTAVRDWIFANMPKVTQGGTAYLVVTVLGTDGSLTDRVFTPAQTAGLRTAINTFKATVI